MTPSITTVWQNTEKIASSAADIIVKMIDDPSFSSYHLTLGVRLIERDSTRCG
ncbi:MAG: substrate-binding domain-containing protein [Oscillospiraceae bacterium]